MTARPDESTPCGQEHDTASLEIAAQIRAHITKTLELSGDPDGPGADADDPGRSTIVRKNRDNDPKNAGSDDADDADDGFRGLSGDPSNPQQTETTP